MPPLKDKVLVDSRISVRSVFTKWETEDGQGHTCTGFAFLFPSSLFIGESDINKYEKSIIHNKEKQTKNPAIKPSVLISVRKTTDRWFGAAFLRGRRGTWFWRKTARPATPSGAGVTELPRSAALPLSEPSLFSYRSPHRSRKSWHSHRHIDRAQPGFNASRFVSRHFSISSTGHDTEQNSK